VSGDDFSQWINELREIENLFIIAPSPSQGQGKRNNRLNLVSKEV
jgi:hypothetical protein